MNDNQIFNEKHRPDIDGLRAVAVLSVVSFHAAPNLITGGFIGVDVFFVISGYLISNIIFKNLLNDSFCFADFYARRIVRIFPALLLVLTSCFMFGWFALLSDEYKQLGKHIAGGVFFVSNFVLLSEDGYFDNSAETKPLLHLWSLGIEEQFYIFWPLLLWLAWKLKFNFFTILVVSIFISFAINIVVVNQDIVSAFYSPQTRIWELISGGLLAWFELNKPLCFSKVDMNFSWLLCASRTTKYLTKNLLLKLNDIISIVGVIILALGFLFIDKNSNFPGVIALVPVSAAFLIIMAGSNACINRMLLSSKILVWFGLISFPLYLWHWPLLSFARIIASENPSRGLRIAAVLLSIFLAWLTYKFLEYPLRFGNHKKTKVVVLSVLMSIMAYIGYNTFVREGFEFRNSIQGYHNQKNELARTPPVDSDCFKYIGIPEPLFPYCRFTNANSDETIAVIGDSHAHVAYPGISDYLKNNGKNTLLLANSSCPPFLGIFTGDNQLDKDACKARIEQLLKTVAENPAIKKVFIFTRGPVYITGTEPFTGSKNLTGGVAIPIAEFVNSAQLTFDRLTESGKTLYYVTENPELIYSAASCFDRPFKSRVKNCSLDKISVLERQADYLNAFRNLRNVTLIDSLNAFCPRLKCLVFDDEGFLLYADDDHLSVKGSAFQVDVLLKEFLY